MNIEWIPSFRLHSGVVESTNGLFIFY